MGNWKTKLKAADLADHQRLEMTCRRCGNLSYLTKSLICTSSDRLSLYLDEVEKEARCRARGCGGSLRMGMVRLDEMTGFVGGMA